jgi:DNA-binding response OmpR family regulator
MPRVLVVADESWVLNQVHAALNGSDFDLVDHADPTTIATAVDGTDIVVVDLQVANMGGMAVARAMKAIPADDGPIPVVILLDRTADEFLARRAGAETWVVKPFTSRQLRNAIAAAIAVRGAAE